MGKTNLKVWSKEGNLARGGLLPGPKLKTFKIILKSTETEKKSLYEFEAQNVMLLKLQ